MIVQDTLPLQQNTASSTASSAAPNSNNSLAAAQNRDKVTSPNPIIDSVKSYDSDKTLSGKDGVAMKSCGTLKSSKVLYVCY